MGIRFLANNEASFEGTIWKQISPADQGMRVFVRKNEESNYNRLRNEAKKDYHARYLFNELMSLNNRHGLTRSIVSRFRQDQCNLQLEGGFIDYSMLSGCVFIKDYGVTQSRGEDKAGLYYVDMSRGKAELKSTTRISTRHIAVNGAFKDSIKAAEKLPEFIERGYKPETTQGTLEKSGYSLFYNDCGPGIRSDFRQFFDTSNIRGGTEVAKKLAQLIQIEAKHEKETCWTLHEKGHAVFKRALQLALSDLSPADKSRLAKHKVFYANPTMNLSVIDHYRKHAGMQLAPQPPLLNNFSLEQTWVTGNFASETHVSMRQLKEQGENSSGNVTSGHIAANALARGLMVGTSYGLPAQFAAASVAGWALTWATIALSNMGGANQKIIESNADVLNHMKGLVSQRRA
ncbi:hypothetical protein [Thalassolituus oleivorans]|uniref:hypothetical protein n=1 Tax=Thalassolituus oleivorans TaxID=187493 RepID=UPI0023F4CF43|nr:hypothetical protein [Thalassolituus oleivorans]